MDATPTSSASTSPISTFSTQQSRALLQRAQSVIPKGVYGHYGSAIGRESPIFFQSAAGSRFVDVDANTYIDWMCAHGPMVLGYNHGAVDEAAAQQMEQGNTVSLASPVLIDLAEELVGMVDDMDWALFGKNGADATSLAVMVARAATGRKYIVKIDDGYHGSAPWMQRSEAPGTVAQDHSLVISIPWNDVVAFEEAVRAHKGEIAAFISSPYHHPVLTDNVLPADGWWSAVQQICRSNDIVLIVDDVRAGLRINLAGSHVAYGFKPDLVCMGKALGNGHPIAALLGTEALMEAAGDTFYTGTQFFNAAPMAAALATLRELRAIDGANLMTKLGTQLNTGLVDLAGSHGLDLRATGVPSMPYFRIESEGGFRFHAAWIRECVKRGAYLLSYHNNFVSTAHTEADIAHTLAIADQAFAAVGQPESG